jgi:hypothetical protein
MAASAATSGSPPSPAATGKGMVSIHSTTKTAENFCQNFNFHISFLIYQ